MSFQDDGFVVVENIFSSAFCAELIEKAQVDSVQSAGCRSFLDHDWCRELATDLRNQLSNRFEDIQGSVAVQCIYFHKTSEKNWLVPWHQDRIIPVAKKVRSKKLSGWSRKEGTDFVLCPEQVLSKMLAVRLHLDGATKHNGPCA